MRVYFDASVIIAALLSPKGGSSELFRLIKKGIVKGVTSQTVVEEVLEEDKPEKLGRSKDQIAYFIGESGLLIRKSITEKDIELYKDLIDIEDAHLIAGAKLTRCSYLVSLDKKHVLKSDIKKKFLPLHIVSPKELLEEIVLTK